MIESYFDGSCKNNPGKLGSWGYLICDPWIEEHGIIKNNRVTNNLAEYTALKNLLLHLNRLDIKSTIHGDSKLICHTVNKKWGFKKNVWNPHRKYPRLRNLAIKCQQLLIQGQHNLKWIPREQNSMADEIANKAYY